MQTKLLGCLAATVMAAAIVVATPALAFRGGGGLGGGGFGGGGMHFGGGGFGGGGFRGGMVTGRSVFVPGGNRFVGAPFAGQRFFANRFNSFAFRHHAFFFRHHPFFFRHHRFRNFALFGFGVPFAYGYAAYGNTCWRQVWTPYGWQWTNICYDYGYNYGY